MLVRFQWEPVLRLAKKALAELAAEKKKALLLFLRPPESRALELLEIVASGLEQFGRAEARRRGDPLFAGLPPWPILWFVRLALASP